MSFFSKVIYSWGGDGGAMLFMMVGILFLTVYNIVIIIQDKREAKRNWKKQQGIWAFGYALNTPLDKIRESYRFDATCKGSVPQAIIAFLESESYEDAIRKAISIGGDSDTIACMAGGIAQAFYGGVPQPIVDKVRTLLDQRLNRVVSEFMNRYGNSVYG